MCQHSFLSYLVHIQLSRFCNMVRTWDMLDTALPIISMLCDTEAAQQHRNEQLWCRRPWGSAVPLSCVNTVNKLPVNPSSSLQMHMHVPWNVHLQLGLKGWRTRSQGGLIAAVTGVDYRAYDNGKLVSDVAWKSTKSLHTQWSVTTAHLPLSYNVSLCQTPRQRVLKVNFCCYMTNSNSNFNFSL